ncbi:hypothetical protein CYMTET_55504 [Cymbomonas tetramitiformis]|uniref:CRAL-TRIO domain-containing protein n=1 Tax=Cymbomonas tetramitiformis TaxID=36881 RepID=A0AAE0EMR6_9CHLO|nr:hypothetical protein CYMTET_55504 [Cymbomonas tetramitiformis]
MENPADYFNRLLEGFTGSGTTDNDSDGDEPSEEEGFGHPLERLYLQNFFPPPEAVHSGSRLADSTRHIFGDLPLEKYETEALSAFSTFCHEEGTLVIEVDDKLEIVEFQGTCFHDPTNRLRFLQGNQWNFAEALKDMRAHIQWRSANLHDKRFDDTLNALLTKGVMYIHGRDKCMRPIIVCRGEALVALSSEDATRLIVHTMQLCIDRLFVKNKVEQVHVIVDLCGVSFFSMPTSVVKDLATTLERNFRARLSVCHIINAPTLFWAIWSVTSIFLSPGTQQKIKVLTTEEEMVTELSAKINKSQLEHKFGGECPNLVDFASQSPKSLPPPYN